MAVEPVPAWQLAAILREAAAALASLYPRGGRPVIQHPPRLIGPDAVAANRVRDMCTRKVCHGSYQEAVTVLHDDVGRAKTHLIGCRPYECPHCGFWHNGHPAHFDRAHVA